MYKTAIPSTITSGVKSGVKYSYENSQEILDKEEGDFLLRNNTHKNTAVNATSIN